jgi:sulfur-carrier protein
MPTVRIPTPLRKLTQGREEVSAAGGTVGEVLVSLERAFPGLRDKICDESGNLRRFVNVFVHEEDIRFLQSLETPVKEGDEIAIVPAIAGGIATGGDMARGKYYLTFPRDLEEQAVICEMYDRLGVRFSIRQAQVGDDLAILGVELSGAEERLRRAVDFLVSRGVRVEPIGPAVASPAPTAPPE